MEYTSKILITGSKGLVGRNLFTELINQGYKNIIGTKSSDLDLRNYNEVSNFFEKHRPEYVVNCAAIVGGIKSNATYPVNFLLENLKIQNNIIENCFNFKVKKLLFLGSSCIYPKMSPQPIKEEYLGTSKLEESNEPYAIAKIAGIKLCQAYRAQYGCNFICAMPTNLYGIGDSYDLQNSHVLPALIRKFYTAKVQNLPFVELWGDGTEIRREFLYAGDLAKALIFLLKNYNDNEIINIGVGKDISIKELAFKIKDLIGYNGDINFNGVSNLNGTPRKLLDISKINNLGWKAETSLNDGIKIAIDNYDLMYNLGMV